MTSAENKHDQICTPCSAGAMGAFSHGIVRTQNMHNCIVKHTNNIKHI